MPAPSPDAPDFLTVEEAARVLRVGRTTAYALTRTWRETDGREGLPVVEFGRLLRVPRAALETISGGPITTATAVPAPTAPAPEPVVRPTAERAERTRSSHRSHRRTRTASRDQTTLPFD
jgi:excisionase family DNA binding protein